MYLRTVTPLMRRAAGFAAPAIVAALLLTTSTAFSQDRSSENFSSSNDAATSSSADVAPLPAAPASQHDTSYGNGGGHHGYAMSHLAFEAGGGFNAPSKGSSPYITYGGNFTVGAGLRMQKHVSVLAEYQFMDDKLPGNLIGETGANGGHAHIWSLTLDPVIDLAPGRKNDLYVTGGGGFYRKVTSFTDPQTVQYCDYYYCGIGTQNAVVGHFSSNQGGWNAGAGYTHTLGSQMYGNNVKLFAEARYVFIDTPAVQSNPNGLGTTTVAAETKLVPVTLGIRF
jgi:hypothetical protein